MKGEQAGLALVQQDPGGAPFLQQSEPPSSSENEHRGGEGVRLRRGSGHDAHRQESASRSSRPWIADVIASLVGARRAHRAFPEPKGGRRRATPRIAHLERHRIVPVDADRARSEIDERARGTAFAKRGERRVHGVAFGDRAEIEGQASVEVGFSRRGLELHPSIAVGLESGIEGPLGGRRDVERELEHGEGIRGQHGLSEPIEPGDFRALVPSRQGPLDLRHPIEGRAHRARRGLEIRGVNLRNGSEEVANLASGMALSVRRSRQEQHEREDASS